MGFNPWTLIKNFPSDGTGKLYEVCGDSNQLTRRWFIIAAFRDEDGLWRDVTTEPLVNSGWMPQYFRRLSTFPKKDPKD